ncbi:hypothetical protein RRG08_064440 [Elysia crispata]|uniref:Uncharacterized protein n=1 Tax=Elysia crispata TaxID=231223 RepID=A0AAE1D6Z1_9GAST|nr:hypothetical protein RRG08_064440 [Elysia crispata]
MHGPELNLKPQEAAKVEKDVSERTEVRDCMTASFAQTEIKKNPNQPGERAIGGSLVSSYLGGVFCSSDVMDLFNISICPAIATGKIPTQETQVATKLGSLSGRQAFSEETQSLHTMRFVNF